MSLLPDPNSGPVRAYELPLIGRDERGQTLVIPNRRSGDFMLGFRKAASSSGRHYHSGLRANKNPEILILISGEAELRWRWLQDTRLQVLKLKGPVRLEVDAGIWHELYALSDLVFWEMNSLEDVQADSIRIEYGEPDPEPGNGPAHKTEL